MSTLNTNPNSYDWTNAHNVRHYHSTDKQPIVKSTSLTYGTAFVADFEPIEEPRRVQGWPDDYMVKARVVTEHGEDVLHLGCDEDGTPTRVVHGKATNKPFR